MRNRTKNFYPDYLSEIAVVIFLVIGIVAVLALLFSPSVTMEINFAAAYHPKPEWYFLWLYYLVGFFPGKWAFIGSVMAPLLMITALLYVPRLDRDTGRSNTLARVCFFLLLGIFLILTLIPLLNA